MRLRRLELRVQSAMGPLAAALDFPDGLVVVRAENSMGKSCCFKAIVVALGLEGMITTSQADLPLPPALLSVVDIVGQTAEVVESEVSLEIENEKHQRITVTRCLKGPKNKNLIQVTYGPALTLPGQYKSADFFVNRPGGATRETGFHHFLEAYLNWQLPDVRTFDGGLAKLYLQLLLPYFMVDQLRGWSGTPPSLPSQYRIRDSHRQAIEFLLALDAYKIAARRSELRNQQQHIDAEWTAVRRKAEVLGESIGASVETAPTNPTSLWPPKAVPRLTIQSADGPLSVADYLASLVKEHDELIKVEIPRAASVTAKVSDELSLSEGELRKMEALGARLLDDRTSEEEQVRILDRRLGAISEDIRRHQDLRTLRSMGSSNVSMMTSSACPTCGQDIQDSLIPTAKDVPVMSIEENLALLKDQASTLEEARNSSRRAIDRREMQISGIRRQTGDLRERIRGLRETLVSDGRIPSIAAIQERLTLERRYREIYEASGRFSALLEEWRELSLRWAKVSAELAGLPKDDTSEDDRRKLKHWAALFRDQLEKYGYRSTEIEPITISPDTYRPEYEGFDVPTNISSSAISASDVVRMVWAYLQALMEVARDMPTHHPGFLVFDEPRQQSAAELSFAELLKRAAKSGDFGQQVIFFTSEPRASLKTALHGIPHTLHEIIGRVLAPEADVEQVSEEPPQDAAPE